MCNRIVPSPKRAVLALLALSLTLTGGWGLAACSGGNGPDSENIRRFRERHVDCPRRDLKVPCKYGPDGKLYRF